MCLPKRNIFLLLLSNLKVVGVYSTHIVEHSCPSLHGDALEDSEHSEQDVVKLGDAVIGADP